MVSKFMEKKTTYKLFSALLIMAGKNILNTFPLID
jgi:hypothetical protein